MNNSRFVFFRILMVYFLFLGIQGCGTFNDKVNHELSAFNNDWQFRLDDSEYPEILESSGEWRNLKLPHDWSIEGEFNPAHPATVGGGALPGGVGWYRKTFILPEADTSDRFFIHFDGVYMNSEVYLNGHLLGKRPNGYISFRYALNPHLNYGSNENVLLVRVDNSLQPNSRWYSGSGIYRNVYLVKKQKIRFKHWSTFVSVSDVQDDRATISVESDVINVGSKNEKLKVVLNILGTDNLRLFQESFNIRSSAGKGERIKKRLTLMDPQLWTLENRHLYNLEMILMDGNKELDRVVIPFGVKTFEFKSETGFYLNGESLKIKGVCLHHDLGSLGAEVHERAIIRQLKLLKSMGVNAIRTAHNPPAPELLDLCDRMGFLVMNETFDMWKKAKSQYDYSLYWDEWHEKDLRDHILRDRNHTSVIMWSIGNEILEQWDSSGIAITKELYDIVRALDTTRYIVTGNNYPYPDNKLLEAGVMDVIGYNYKHKEFESFPETFPGKFFIATETTSGLMTRGHYDMPSDSIRRWPYRWDRPFTDGNPDHTVSAYDNVSTPWGSTHEESWKLIKKHDYLSGMFIWTGFDYLGEPTPYGWPSRSSYFGIFDLAGFPKDVYYMYKSEWTDEPVLHLFPHWNWTAGDTIDAWAYTNCEEVELFLNDSSMGTRYNNDTTFHLMWRLEFVPGELKAIGKLPNGEILEQKVVTAGAAAGLTVEADRETMKADGKDLVYVAVQVSDAVGNPVPDANNVIRFSIEGDGKLLATDNGSQTSHESFQAHEKSAFNGKCVAIVQAGLSEGELVVRAESDSLLPGAVSVSLHKIFE